MRSLFSHIPGGELRSHKKENISIKFAETAFTIEYNEFYEGS